MSTVADSTPSLSTRGSSTEAETIQRYVNETRKDVQNTVIFGRQSAFDNLRQIFDECSEEGWDGASAWPISRETYLACGRFLFDLPLSTPSPDLTPCANGSISMEWYQSPHRLLSLSITPSNKIIYASLIGTNKYYGAEQYWGELSPIIRELLARVI